MKGAEKIDGQRFLDWPSSENKPATSRPAGAARDDDAERRAFAAHPRRRITAELCKATAEKLGRHIPDPNNAKQAAALLALAGLRSRATRATRVKVGGPKGVSTFYGYYVLEALAKSGEIDAALDFISHYWGGMLDFGATTFWEDFDLAWTENAGRIDELVPAGKKDLHGDFGAYCYEGFRHSFCHGWASGPTAWLSEQVLGIQPLEPGCAKVRVAPRLGRLKWVEGTYPTPHGPIKVRHDRKSDGRISSRSTRRPGRDRARMIAASSSASGNSSNGCQLDGASWSNALTRRRFTERGNDGREWQVAVSAAHWSTKKCCSGIRTLTMLEAAER